MAYGLGGLLGLLVLTLGLGYALAQSDAGRTWLARQLERLLSEPGTFEVAIGRLDGALPQTVRLVDLRIGDAEGHWLEAAEIRVDWRPLELIGGTLWIRAFEVEELDILRRPAAAGTRDEAAAGFALPELPFRVVVQHLVVDDVGLAAPVLGTAAAFRVQGDADLPDAGDLRAALLIERSDGQPGRLEAEARYRPGDRHLALALTASEPAGGLIARALDLPELPAVTAKLDGAGPLDAWDGRLALEFAELAALEAEANLSGRDELAFRVAGKSEIARDLGGLPWQLLTGRTAFDVTGRWSPSGRLAIERAQLANAAAEMTLSGTLDTGSLETELRAEASLSDGSLLAGRVEGAGSGPLAFKVDLRASPETVDLALDASTPSFRLPGVELRNLAVKAGARGPLRKPELRLAADIGAVTAPGVSAERLRAEAVFRPDRPLDQGPAKGALETTGGAERPRLDAGPEVQALVGERLDWALTGRLDLARGSLAADRLTLSSGPTDISGTGNLMLAEGRAEAALEFALSDLSGLSPWLGFGAAGRVEAGVTVTARDFGRSAEARISGTLAGLALEDRFAQALLTETASFAAGVVLDGGVLKADDLALESPNARISGAVTLAEGFEALQADYRLSVADLGVLAPALQQPLAGAARIEGRAAGRAADPGLSGRLELEGLAAGDLVLARLGLDYAFEDLATGPRGRVSGTADTPLGTVAGQADLRLDGSLLDVDGLSVEAGATSAAGRAAIPLDGGPVVAALEVRSRDLGPWLDFAGVAGGGSGSASLALSDAGGRQAGTLKAELESITLRSAEGERLSSRGLTATLESQDLLGKAEGTIHLVAEGVEAGGLSLETLSLDGRGGPAAVDYRLSAAGDWFGPLRLEAAGRAALDERRVTVEIARLDGTLLDRTVASRQPIRIVQAPGVFELGGADLDFGAARLEASARLGAGKFAADLDIAGLPAAQLEPFWSTGGATGLIAAQVKLGGSLDQPAGRFAFSVTDLRLGALSDAFSQVPPGEFELTGDWRGRRIKLDGSVKGLSNTDIALSADLPLVIDPVTLAPGLPEQEAVSGKVTWQGRVGEIWSLVPVTGHGLSGSGDIGLSLGGTLARPRLTGRLALRDGSYENLAAGTLLRDLNLDVELMGERAVLTVLQATDGGSGTLSAKGALELAPGRGYPLELSGKLKRFTLVRRDDVTAAAAGKFSLAGSLDSAALKGKLKTKGVEIRIPDRLPPQVVALDVVEAGDEDKLAPPDDDRGQAQGRVIRLDLDLAVDLPRRVFLRGRGLDSEWAGTLDVGGTAERPLVEGELALVRGQVSVIGKVFKLERGSVVFGGGETIDPVLNVVATHRAADIEVTVGVSGPASNPVIALNSVPPLPRDEITSRLLFGKATTQLSAFEAAQLAAAVAELTGKGGGAGGILNKARGVLGIDVLRVGTVGSGASATTGVGAGKYVTDQVFVGVNKGTTAESGSVEVEVELTPNISVETEVDQTGRSNVGVKFKWDY